MQKIDAAKTGQFSLQQLENLIRLRGNDTDVIQDIIDALKVFDTDEDGMISKQEFIFAMMNMGDKMNEDEVREIVNEDLGSGPIHIEQFARVIMARI